MNKTNVFLGFFWESEGLPGFITLPFSNITANSNHFCLWPGTLGVSSLLLQRQWGCVSEADQ